MRVTKIYFTYNPIKNPNAIKVSRQYLKSKIKDNSVKLIEYNEINVSNNNDVDPKILNGVKECIAECLNIDIKDVLDNSDFFFDLNGSSLDYFDLVSRINDKFNIKLQFENDSLHTSFKLAKEVERVLSL